MDGTQEMRYIEETFENWGSTLLANVTVRTFFPRTVKGIQNIVRVAGKDGARVRASATRHTFNPWLWGVESNLQPGTAGHRPRKGERVKLFTVRRFRSLSQRLIKILINYNVSNFLLFLSI